MRGTVFFLFVLLFEMMELNPPFTENTNDNNDRWINKRSCVSDRIKTKQ